MSLNKVRIFLLGLAFLISANAHAQVRKDIRAPLIGGPVLVKDLSKEKTLPSLELEQTLSAISQNPAFKLKVVVAKGTPLVAEVEKQVQAKKLLDRVQLVEQ